MSALDPAASAALNLMVAHMAKRIWRVRNVRVATIVEQVAFDTGMTVAEIVGPSRARSCFRPRAAVCWLAVKLGVNSTTGIGRALGNRDHSTVIDACRRAEEFRQRDPAFRRLTDRLLDHFRDLQED